ncbi:PAS domain-containing protein, partial [Streptomyces tendae]
MDHGTERDAPPGHRAGPDAVPADPVTGRVPLAVVVVDRDGLVSHWSRGARRLFALPKEEAIGRSAADLLPVSGVLPGDRAEDDDPAYGSYPDHDGLGPGLGRPLRRLARALLLRPLDGLRRQGPGAHRRRRR